LHEARRVTRVEENLEKGFHGLGLGPIREPEQGNPCGIDVLDPVAGIDVDDGVLAGIED
jgi:hypothetical protein